MASHPGIDLEELQAFSSVVEANGFRAAARLTQARKATLSKRVQALEQRLGVSLLVRTTRALRLTDEGRAYFEHASRALAAARDAEAVVLAAKRAPSGTLRVTTAPSIAGLVLDAVVNTYLARYPEVRLELHTSERRIDLVRERFDLAIWQGALDDSTLIARRLGLAVGGYYASPDYLAKRPKLKHPDDLAAHDLIAVPKSDAPVDWGFLLNGKLKRFPIRPRLTVTDLELGTRAAASGIGIVRAPHPLAAPYLSDRRLTAVLAKFTPPGLDVHAVFPPGGNLVPKTRAFVDLLDGFFRRHRTD